MSEELTYSMLHEMMMKKFNLEANSQINLSFKLSSFDYTVDITDDAEVQFFVECACNSEDEFAHLFVSERQNNKFFNFFETTTFENNGPSNQDINATHLNNNFNNTSVFNNGLSFDLGQNYFQMNESICKNEPYHTNPESSFAFRSNEAYVDENNDSDDGVDENPHNNFHKWNNFMSFKPEIPDTPVYKSKPIISKQYSQQLEVKRGHIFNNKEALVLAVRLKALNNGFQFLVDRSGPYRCELKCYQFKKSDWKLRARLWNNAGQYYITHLDDTHTCSKNQTYPNHRNANKKVMAHLLTPKLQDRQKGVFEMLFIAIGASIRTFLNYLHPMLMIDAAHLKGLYKGTNLVDVAMDENNQIVPIAFGISKGETGPCWSWHAAIALAVENEFPLAFHVLCDARPERWSRAHCPLIRYNYMTSNSVESVNACSVIYRKEPMLKLAETYRAMVQQCTQSGKKSMKSIKWVVKGVNEYQYKVSDGQYIREVNLQAGTCECRKWQLSGIPCGHVIAVTRFLGLTDYVQYVSDWFKKLKYQGTYSESIHFLRNMQQWEFPQNIQKAIPPRMDNPQPGRPKNTKRIQSQGEEPRVIHCSRCTQAGHRRDQCNKPFVVEPPGNIRTQNVQDILRNNEPSFYDPNQHYDNTFHTFNQYTTQPYDQHFTNTSQAYDGHQTESSQMYEQYNSQQYDVQHLDDLNTNGSNSLVPLADAIQERDRILMYTQHNRLHVYVSRVELSTLVVAEQHKDEKNKTENQEKPSCSKKLFD
ncbi:transposase, MuDR, MULE transposase domain protein [Tanacetum coccineum]|uniref:Transposase, MuDR, MULE transposase domain protein n=1 Tax=Tanacetum coccineum TaxID=301880 RepID=A0ABQ4Y226_9ASTR